MDAIRASVVVKRYVCSPAGTRRGNRAQTTPDTSFGPRCVFFKLFFSVLLTTTAPDDAEASFGPFRRFGFHLPFHHRQRVTTTRWRFPRLPSALPPSPTTRVHPLPRAGHLPPHDSQATSPPPTSHLTSPHHHHAARHQPHCQQQ